MNFKKVTHLILMATILLAMTGCVKPDNAPSMPLIVGSQGTVTENYYAYCKKTVKIKKKDFIKRDRTGNLSIFSSGEMARLSIGDKLVVSGRSGAYIKVNKVGSKKGYWIPENIFEVK